MLINKIKSLFKSSKNAEKTKNAEEIESRDIHLTDERFVLFLRRQRERITFGVPLKKEDSNCSGNKYTYCSWGACSGDLETWPDLEDHLFPIKEIEIFEGDIGFDKDGGPKGKIIKQVSSKYRLENQFCPFDKKNFKTPEEKQMGSMGCFYRCKAFSREGLTKEEALRLYDIRIKEFSIT